MQEQKLQSGYTMTEQDLNIEQQVNNCLHDTRQTRKHKRKNSTI